MPASWSARPHAVAASAGPWASTALTGPAAGYLGLQFNAVVASNDGAIALWYSLGFETIGTVPRAFRHPVHGLVDLHIMYRDL